MKYQVKNKAQLYDSNQEEVAGEQLNVGHVFSGKKTSIADQDVILIDNTNGFFVAAHNVSEVDPEELIKQKTGAVARKNRKLIYALLGAAFGYYIGHVLTFSPKGKGIIAVIGIAGGLLYAFKLDQKDNLKTLKTKENV